MKRQVKKVVLPLAACIMAAGILSGCGDLNADDAKEYVQSALDAGYKGEFEQYAKITDSTEEEAKAMYEENIDKVLDSAGVSNLTTSGELKEQYRDLFQKIFALEKYTVGDAKEIDNGFEVSVEIEKLTIFTDMDTALESKLMGRLKELGENAGEDDINRLAVEMMYDLLQERAANPTYGEKETLTVHVTKDDNGTWSISQEDLEALDAAMIE